MSRTCSKLEEARPVQVDFYQLGGKAPEQVIAGIAAKVLADGGRLLVVAEEEAALARLDRQLWDQGPASFLPHGLAGGSDDARQPILLSTSLDAPNLARNMLIADGLWREAALAYDRAFFLFDSGGVEAARDAWRSLTGREGIEPRYWAQSDGKWAQQP
jgi:DNA polymerase-3 subunit chi